MKTLLVSLSPNTDTVGVKYLNSYLCENSIESYILFAPKYDSNSAVLLNFLCKFKPKIIALSFMSHEFNNIKKLTELIKKKLPKTLIVWGGIHPSIDPITCLDCADFVFVGESEESFLEFAQAIKNNKPVKNIKNLAYKSGNKVIINKLRPLKQNLDNLPFPLSFPKRSFILHNNRVTKLTNQLFRKYAKYSGKVYNITASRGCPLSCSFCVNSFFLKLYGKKTIAKRSVKNVINELKLAIKLFPDIIYINSHDDSFLIYDIKWLKEFARLYKKHINKNLAIKAIPYQVTEEKIRILRKAGLSWIQIGLQTGSESINRKIYKRGLSNDSFLKATKIINKYNVVGWYDVILDNPYENEEDILKTINVVLDIPRPYILQIFGLRFYPGTKLYDKALKDNLEVSNSFKSNMHNYKINYLNKTVRLCPYLPKNIIKHLVKYRNFRYGQILLKVLYPTSVLFLEPLTWFRLIFRSYNYNLFRSLSMVFFFAKTGFDKYILRNYV